MNKTKQMSETIRLGMLLAVSGGFMDAYSYIERDQVFANAQTGNMLLFGVNLSEGNFSVAMRYFLPVLAFALGIALAEIVHKKDLNLLHWRHPAALCRSYCRGNEIAGVYDEEKKYYSCDIDHHAGSIHNS